MPYYDSLHTGYWRVQFNEQYCWKWLRDHDFQFGRGFNVAKLALLVEDRLNMCDFTKPVDVNKIIAQEFQTLIQKDRFNVFIPQGESQNGNQLLHL